MKNIGLEAPNFWTRTQFLGVNPKDSTRTRLVLDTLRLVLDSYSKNLDSIQHYCQCVCVLFIFSVGLVDYVLRVLRVLMSPNLSLPPSP